MQDAKNYPTKRKQTPAVLPQPEARPVAAEAVHALPQETITGSNVQKGTEMPVQDEATAVGGSGPAHVEIEQPKGPQTPLGLPFKPVSFFQFGNKNQQLFTV